MDAWRPLANVHVPFACAPTACMPAPPSRRPHVHRVAPGQSPGAQGARTNGDTRRAGDEAARAARVAEPASAPPPPARATLRPPPARSRYSRGGVDLGSALLGPTRQRSAPPSGTAHALARRRLQPAMDYVEHRMAEQAARETARHVGPAAAGPPPPSCLLS